MAWHYARAIETITEAGKAELPLPMYKPDRWARWPI